MDFDVLSLCNDRVKNHVGLKRGLVVQWVGRIGVVGVIECIYSTSFSHILLNFRLFGINFKKT